MEQSIRLERRFAIIDEWLLDLDISDRAVRLYAVLARYADSETHKAYPSRGTLAERLRCSKASVDRAAQELVDAGAMTKKQRHNSSVIYTLQVSSSLQRGVITDDEGGSAPVTRGVLTGDDLTRTTELEPNNDISKKAKQVPSDWKPSPEFAIECNEKFPTLTIANEVEAFIDYHTANGSTFKDFNAAFRTWCRNAVKFQAPKTVIHQQQQSKSPHVGGLRDWVQEMHDMGEHFECREGEFGCK
jgi:hypothetical protein